MTLLEVINKRVPRRTYLNQEIEKEKLDLIKKMVLEINDESGLSILEVQDKEKFNNSFLAKKYLYKNVSNYLVIKANKDLPNLMEKAGFYGEKLALEMGSLGLSSCFVTINFDKKNMYCEENEVIICLLVFGYSPGLTKKEKVIQKVTDFKVKEKTDLLVAANSLDSDIETGINATLRIPAVYNGNIYFVIDDNYIGCYVKNKEYFELGMAKLHFYVGSNKLIPFGNHNKVKYK